MSLLIYLVGPRKKQKWIYIHFFGNFVVIIHGFILVQNSVCVCVRVYLLSKDTQTNAPNIWSNECFPFQKIFIEKRWRQWQRAHMSRWWLFTKEIHKSRRRETTQKFKYALHVTTENIHRVVIKHLSIYNKDAHKYLTKMCIIFARQKALRPIYTTYGQPHNSILIWKYFCLHGALTLCVWMFFSSSISFFLVLLPRKLEAHNKRRRHTPKKRKAC